MVLEHIVADAPHGPALDLGRDRELVHFEARFRDLGVIAPELVIEVLRRAGDVVVPEDLVDDLLPVFPVERDAAADVVLDQDGLARLVEADVP